MSFEKVDLKIHIKERMNAAKLLKEKAMSILYESNAIEAEMEKLCTVFDINLDKSETK